jgi:hypothetical protein
MSFKISLIFDVVADAQELDRIKWKNPKRIHPLSGTFGNYIKNK